MVSAIDRVINIVVQCTSVAVSVASGDFKRVICQSPSNLMNILRNTVKTMAETIDNESLELIYNVAQEAWKREIRCTS
ncbi:hypothetical protein Glove_228g113 [Diversispora epigaea]|uniref:Uncharacterized protein n=1 Tax=Diversispora epigaea TaxID=1348612 RepID=A0A397IMF3_9GLOM|nr:hypothetical protein Glove_228g113 [Diversispora epigaea]